MKVGNDASQIDGKLQVLTDVKGEAKPLFCESSGGRILEPGDLSRLLKELNSEKSDATPRTRISPVWNRAWVFYLTGVLFGLDWFLRRRWGLC